MNGNQAPARKFGGSWLWSQGHRLAQAGAASTVTAWARSSFRPCHGWWWPPTPWVELVLQ